MNKFQKMIARIFKIPTTEEIYPEDLNVIEIKTERKVPEIIQAKVQITQAMAEVIPKEIVLEMVRHKILEELKNNITDFAEVERETDPFTMEKVTRARLYVWRPEKENPANETDQCR